MQNTSSVNDLLQSQCWLWIRDWPAGQVALSLCLLGCLLLVEIIAGVCSEQELRIVREDPVEIAVQIDPEPSSGGLQYVHACLTLETSSGYPEIPAHCILRDVKGVCLQNIAQTPFHQRNLQPLRHKSGGVMSLAQSLASTYLCI